jgi:ubiquinone/menaquinone biosynthesis C-methylase UbiE
MSRLEEILRCPTCGKGLEKGEDLFRCVACRTDYHKVEGIPDFLPGSSSTLKLAERSHFSAKSEDYSRMHQDWSGSPFYRHYHEDFLRDLRALPPGSLILETGCGLGHDGLELLESGYRVVETDIALGQLLEASKLQSGRASGGRADYVLADAEYLPFADACFDGAFMVASLHHLPDPLRALTEMRRVVRREGVVVVGTEPNAWQNRTIYPLGKMLMKAIQRMTGKEMGTGHLVSEADKQLEGFSEKELLRLFREAGFGEVLVKPGGYLSAAVFFATTELSFMTGRDFRMFALERLALPVDGFIGRLPLVKHYPWHWNAVAS